MALRELNKREARQVALNYLTTNSKSEAYKLFNPLWANLKRRSLHTLTYSLFNQPTVRLSIVDIQDDIYTGAMERMKITLDGQLEVLNRAIKIAEEDRNPLAMKACVGEQNKMTKMYDKVSDDAITLDVCMRRPPAPELRAVSPPPALPTA